MTHLKSKKYLLIWFTFVIPQYLVLVSAIIMNDSGVWTFAKFFVGVVAFGISSYLGFNVGQKVWLNNGNNKNNKEKKP